MEKTGRINAAWAVGDTALWGGICTKSCRPTGQRWGRAIAGSRWGAGQGRVGWEGRSAGASNLDALPPFRDTSQEFHASDESSGGFFHHTSLEFHASDESGGVTPHQSFMHQMSQVAAYFFNAGEDLQGGLRWWKCVEVAASTILLHVAERADAWWCQPQANWQKCRPSSGHGQGKVAAKKKADRNVRYTLADWMTVRRAFLDYWPFPLDAVTPSFERDGFVCDEQQMVGNPFLGGAGTAGQVKLLQCLIYTWSFIYLDMYIRSIMSLR